MKLFHNELVKAFVFVVALNILIVGCIGLLVHCGPEPQPEPQPDPIKIENSSRIKYFPVSRHVQCPLCETQGELCSFDVEANKYYYVCKGKHFFLTDKHSNFIRTLP